MTPYERVFSRVIGFFEELEQEKWLSYFVVGGTLTSSYAQARQTQDIDFVIKILVEGNVKQSLGEKLNEAGFQPFSTWESTLEGLEENHFLNFLDPSGLVKIDLSVIPVHPRNKYERLGPLELERRIRADIFGVNCWIQSKEDFILSKLVYGGIQDYRDALGCWIRYSGKFDLNYLENQARIFNVEREFESLRKETPVEKMFPDF